MKKIVFLLLLIPVLAFPQRRWSSLIAAGDTVISADIDDSLYFMTLDISEALDADKNKLFGYNTFSSTLNFVPNNSATGVTETMTSNLKLGADNSFDSRYLYINKGQSSEFSSIFGQTNSSARWELVLGDDDSESSSAEGSNFELRRYSNSGVILGGGDPIRIDREDGIVDMVFGATMGDDLTVTGGNISTNQTTSTGGLTVSGTATIDSLSVTDEIDSLDIRTITVDSIVAGDDVPKFPDGLKFDSDTLSDYSMGIWTVNAYDASTGGNSAAQSSYQCSYVKIGHAVHISIIVSGVNITGLTGGNNIFFDLPFTVSTTAGSGTLGFVFAGMDSNINMDAGNYVFTGFAYPWGSARFALIEDGPNNNETYIRVNQFTDDADSFRITGFYITDE